MSVRRDDPGRPACLAQTGFYVVIDVPDIALPVTSGVSYDVKVRRITPFEEDPYCNPKSIIAGEIDLFQVTDLGVTGQGVGMNRYSVDLHLASSLFSPSATPTYDGTGNPTLGTSFLDGPSTTLHLHPNTGSAQVEALAFEPSASPVDLAVAYGTGQIHHIP